MAETGPYPMTHEWTLTDASEGDLARLAQLLALKIRTGDLVALHGDLGAGKTTLARALIRAVLADDTADVPSPTFSLLQTYAASRLNLAHLDLYRLGGNDDLAELGLDELSIHAAVLVEWPERAVWPSYDGRLDVALRESGNVACRNVMLSGSGTWEARLRRIAELWDFLGAQKDWRNASIRYLQGDASARAYARLSGPSVPAILMDSPRQPDGPPIRDGLPYSRIAHLAEDVSAFVAMDGLLREHGFSAPELYASDIDRGLVILEDFGDRVFGAEVAAGQPLDDMWRAAVDTLVALRGLPTTSEPIAADERHTHHLPLYDTSALAIETELLPDWYWSALFGAPVPAEVRDNYVRLWADALAHVTAADARLTLRDYHSPNLIWLPERPGTSRVGLIDFQDAVRGHPAYDLVSLLQDARLDVPERLEAGMLDHYCRLCAAREPAFDDGAFRLAYAVLGAQRNSKILGIFARLHRRDGKPLYLKHMPRLWIYLGRNLAHPGLAALRRWYDRHLPAELRTRVLEGA